jgi:hypothetical protein
MNPELEKLNRYFETKQPITAEEISKLTLGSYRLGLETGYWKGYEKGYDIQLPTNCLDKEQLAEIISEIEKLK